MGRSATYRTGWAWALGIGLLMAALSLRGALGGLEWRAYDMQLGNRAAHAPQHSDILIVMIGDRCLDSDRLGPWPWPMARHAQLVRRIAQGRPRAIVFDILFLGKLDPGAAEFAQALREAGNAYLAVCFLQGKRPMSLGRYGARVSELRQPPSELTHAAAGLGAVNIFPERDGVVRSSPLLFDYGGRPYPSLPLQVAADVIPFNIEKATWPVTSSKEMLVSYAGGYRHFQTVGYDEVLAGTLPPQTFRNRIVLVGFSATGLSDTRPTPLSPALPGVEINAHALNTLLRANSMRPLGGIGNALFVLGVAAVMGMLLRRLRPVGTLGAGIGAAVVVVLVVAAAFYFAGLWINMVTPALTAAMVGLAVAVVRYRTGEREQIRAESSLGALALATRMIAASTSREPVLDAIREEITQVVGARQTDIYLVDADTEELVLVGSDGRTRVPMGRGALGQVASEGVPLVVDASSSAERSRELGQATTFNVGTAALVPLRRQNEVVGVIQVARESGVEPFGERDLELLNALAQEAAVALENVELYEKLEGKVELANREMIRAYLELALEKDRISALLENMTDGVIMTDMEQQVLYVNPAAERMFHIAGSQIQGEPLAWHFDIPALLDVVSAARAEPDRLTTGTIALEEPHRMVLTANSAVIADDHGQLVGVVTVLSDVTLLQELSDMKTEFVSMVSHELRTPLTSIQGFAQTLRSDTQGDFDAQTRDEFLEIIESECYRLLSMINELLDASRIEAGRALPLNWTQVSLPEIVERAVKLHSASAPQHRFEVEFAPDLPLVDADADRLQQVLTNLISNAVKYSPEGGAVRISGAVEDCQVQIAIRDEGLGMTEAQRALLFQRYQRIESDASKRIRGTGLGLYLTKGLVEAHGGRIWAHSDGPGRGSVFSFALPIKRVEERPEQTAAPTSGG